MLSSKGAAVKGCRHQRVPPSDRGYQEYLISVQEYFIFVQEYLIFVQVYFIFVQEYLISVQEYFIFVQEYIFGKFTKDHLADLSRLLGLVKTMVCIFLHEMTELVECNHLEKK